MTEIEFHPLATMFPPLGDAEISQLADDIKANGLREKVTLFEGKVLDGRHRCLACRKAGVDPEFYELNPDRDGDPLAYVVSKNLRRRQLNESQRALVAARIANLRQGQPVSGKPENFPVSQATAAAIANVSDRSLRFAKAVLESPDLLRAVERGKLRVSEAAKAAKLPNAIQKQIADLAQDGRAKEARAAVHNASNGEDERRAAIEEASEKALSFLDTYGEECTAFLLDLGNPRLFLKALREQKPQGPADVTPPPIAVPPSTDVPNDDGHARPRSRRTSKRARIPDVAPQAHAG
jgi:ParB-like chromosome segregation protein Spo0J